MYYQGLIIGAMAFLVIGLFHPVVIKAEYFFGRKIWPVFLFFGLVFIGVSLFLANLYLSSFFGIMGFSFLWSIHEITEQDKRVKRGWFPANPKRKDKES